MFVSFSTPRAISKACSDRVFRPWAVRSMFMEGKRSVRAETTTFRATTMATKSTVIRVATPPRFTLLKLKGFLGAFCFFSFLASWGFWGSWVTGVWISLFSSIARSLL